MPYITASDIEARFTDAFLDQALDDDTDGVRDTGLLESVLTAASDDVDGILGAAYTVPFSSPYPAAAKGAALAFACELLYARRMGKSSKDVNPWTARADDWRRRLEDIVLGKVPLRSATATAGGAFTTPDTNFLPANQDGI